MIEPRLCWWTVGIGLVVALTALPRNGVAVNRARCFRARIDPHGSAERSP
jgi:hypothetical protein